MKIAVLGNGSIGCMAAFNLSNDGHKVVLFGDKEKTRVEKVYKKLGIKNFGIHPEMVSLYEYKRMTY